MDDLSGINGIPDPDTSYLNDIAGGDNEIARQLISIFEDDYPALIEGLKEGARKGDFDKVKFLTHKLVSQLPIVGISSAVEDVRLMNKECSSMTDLPERIDNLEKLIEYSLQKLKIFYNFS